ncbi:transposase [Pedobacter sp. BS3]|nr:transposase [Pedobacter sp. BS3]
MQRRRNDSLSSADAVEATTVCLQCKNLYGRKIAKSFRQDIHFMWLSGMSRPDFRTINNFRSSKAKEAIKQLFQQMLLFLMDHGYIRMENYFCDGSTISADY